MKKLFIPFALLVVMILAACNNTTNTSSNGTADAIYFGGDIITMEGDSATYAEAVAVTDGKIVFVGSKADAEKMKGDSTAMHDLQGKTLLPGFIDPHSHFMFSLAMTTQANCFAPPVGPAKDSDGIIAALKELKEKKNIPAGELITGYGYDENQMPNGRLLNRDDLDKVSTEHPVMVIHVSGHGCVLNTAGLKKFGINASTVTPEGGIIIRKPGTKEPYELIMETAYLPVFSNLPHPKPEELMQQLRDGQKFYAEAGVTTAQEGSTHKSDVGLLIDAAKQNNLLIDVVSYPFILEAQTILKDYPFAQYSSYSNHFKIGGVKIVADGSPQGKTAFFTTPFLTGGPSGEKNWKGEPTFPQDSMNAWVTWLYREKIQVNIHANGDAAMDMLLVAHEYACKELNQPLDADRRTTIIHSQFVRKDQLEKYKMYNIIPSFFTEHTFYFGDTHIQNRGMEQASFLSPLNSAFKMGIPATNHTDFNVLPIDQMMVIWSAVNRTTRTGVLLGADERVTPYNALKAITINVAHQYFEEDSKGSLVAGKLADLVILDQNPLKVDALKIKDIKVAETVKEGMTIYKQ
jgi:predicted amidohydrolase YtcJ